MSFSIGQRPKPSSNDSDSVRFFAIDQITQPRLPLGRNYSRGMVRETGQYGHIVAVLCPVPGQFDRTRRRGSHLRRKVLGNVEDFHLGVSSSTI